MNNNELIKSEIKFILTLHEQTKQALLNHYLIQINIPSAAQIL